MRDRLRLIGYGAAEEVARAKAFAATDLWLMDDAAATIDPDSFDAHQPDLRRAWRISMNGASEESHVVATKLLELESADLLPLSRFLDLLIVEAYRTQGLARPRVFVSKLQIRLTDSELRSAEAGAVQSGLTVSEFARECLHRLLDNPEVSVQRETVGNRSRGCRMEVRLDEDTNRRLNVFANGQQLSRSTVARAALRRFA